MNIEAYNIDSLRKLVRDLQAENKELQLNLQTLETENRLLKERLEEAGISYADIVSNNSDESTELYDPNQGARIKKFEITDKIASDFFIMFCRGRFLRAICCD